MMHNVEWLNIDVALFIRNGNNALCLGPGSVDSVVALDGFDYLLAAQYRDTRSLACSVDLKIWKTC